MMSETQMGALRVLEALDDGETAYTVNISNPVCPCCGARLVIQDDIPKGQNTELNTEAMVDEQYADSSAIMPMVAEVAKDIIEGYTAFCEEKRMDDRQIYDSLRYPRDPDLADAISRKAKELKSLFNSSYGLIVNEQIIVQDLKDTIRRMVMNGSRNRV